MILKFFEINKINLDKNNIILFYGKNEGLKDEVSRKIIKNNNILSYEEREILNDTKNFMEQILSKSLFEEEKFLIVKRSTDKLVNVIQEIVDKKIDDIKIIFNADSLEKKSKLRSLFEKDKRLICVAFYPDTEQTLIKYAYDYFKKLKISISSENINLIVNKCNGDRKILLNELNKIECYAKGKKNISTKQISKITNLLENHSISELIDCCLIKNKKRTIKILNENNFSNEDCILIIRTFLNKLKRILILAQDLEKNKNIDMTLTSAKPPIFWKDKEIIKQQISKLKPEKIRKLIYQTNNIELLVKKNVSNSLNLVTNFVLEKIQ
tara:strand:- start:71 stop:1045 length:975 start_codon:yes stop_codon:yes gene_type:complete